MSNTYCPICAENIDNEPFCFSCGEISGSKSEEYKLHERDYYIKKQIKIFGKIIVEPKNYLKEEN